MSCNSFSRRTILKATAATGASRIRDAAARCGAAGGKPITPALIDAAKKEGKLVFYTAMDLQLAEHFGKTFEAKYPGIAVRVERSGAERVFQRIGQEYGSNIHAVDVVNTADQAHCIIWKRTAGLLPTCRKKWPSITTRLITIPTALHLTTRVLVSPFGIQYQPGEDGRRAEELRRPARSEMGRQNGEGASRL